MTNMDSGSIAGTAGETNPTDSSATNAQPSSNVVTITKEAWDGLQQDIQTLKSGLQSDKDRAVRSANQRMDKLESELRPLFERVHQFGAQNKSFDEALSTVRAEQDEQDFRNAVRDLAGKLNGGALPAAAGAGNTGGAGVDVDAVFTQYGLDLKDPFVAGKLGGKTFANSEEAELTAGRILREKLSTPAASDAQQSATSGTVTQTANLDELYARYAEAFKNPTKNADLMEDLERQMKAQGG